MSITQEQAKKLKVLLEQSAVSTRIYIGMRYSEPTIQEAVAEAGKTGVKQAVVITLAPQYSEMSVGAYLKLFDEAHDALGKPFRVKKVRSYGTHPLFLDAVAENLTKIRGHNTNFRGENSFVSPNFNPKTTPVIFSAHSLPVKMIEKDDPYVSELKQGGRAISERLNLGKTRFAFSSKGGGPLEWLGPSIEDVLEELKNEGETQVVVSPLGFVSDHVETLYDLDVLAREKAEKLGLEFRRAPSLNDSPGFIKLLASLVKENIG